MKVAHQNVPVAELPGVSRGGFMGGLFGPAPAASSDRLTPADRMVPPAPVAGGGNVRPQADRGLDGWFLDRIFGRR